MKLLYISLLASLVLFSSCRFFGGRRIHGDGHIVTETRAVSAFNNLEVRGGIDVKLRQDATAALSIQGDQNLMQYIEVYNEGTTLVVRTRDGVNLRPSKDMVIFVAAPLYKEVTVSGAGDISSEGTITAAEPMNVRVSGAGDVNMAVQLPRITTRISGSGSINLRGQATEFDAEVSGAGAVKSFDLMTERTEIQLSGAGDAEVSASKELKVRVSGAGDVKYKGNPTVSQHVSGAGSVTKVG